MTDIAPVTADRLSDLEDLFNSNAATEGCWCMGFIVPRSEYYAGRRGGNRDRFIDLAATADPPLGLLASREGVPVGWCATGPRSRYKVATSNRSILMRRDPTEDDNVWLVPCFFVRVGHRRSSLTEELLTAAVEFAERYEAAAIEGWPIANTYDSPTSFEGREHVFERCGFACVARPSPRRAVMRLDLPRAGRYN